MRLSLFLTALFVFPLASGCNRPSSSVDAELATQRLCNLLSTERKRMIVNTVGSDIVWSDGALMERASSVPAQLQALINHPNETRDMLALLQSLDARKSEWHSANLARTGDGDFGCEVTDGKIKAPVNCVYTTYLEARYPKVQVRLQSDVDPILFIVDDRLRAVLMPVKY